MITTALILSVSTLAAFYVLYQKMPHRFKAFLIKHSTATDIGAALATYWLHASFGGGITALAAAGMVSLQTSMMLAIARDPELSEACSSLMKKITSLRGVAVQGMRKMLVKQASVSNA